MDKFIRFRMQADTLSVDEYRSFLSNIINESNMNEFSSMIFKHLIQKTNPKGMQIDTINEGISSIISQRNVANDDMEKGSQIDTINEGISSIISQRNVANDDMEKGSQIDTINEGISSSISQPNVVNDDTEKDSDTDNNEIQSLDLFPDSLIQEIGSFLPFKCYSNFQCTSRSIFYAANNPFAIQQLDNVDLQECFHLSHVHGLESYMQRFQRVRKLIIGAKNYLFIPVIKFKNVEQLTFDRSCNDTSVNGNILKLDWRQIRFLTLDFAAFDISDYFLATKCLSNVQHLVLGSVGFEPNNFLKYIGNQLKSLSMDMYAVDYSFDGVTFHELEELEIFDSLEIEVTSILKVTKCLKRLTIYDINEDCFTQNGFEQIFALDLLEYVYVYWTGNDILDLVQCIEAGFHKKRDNLILEIKYWNDHFHVFTGDKLQETVVRLSNTLQFWHTSKFMLRFSFKFGREKENEMEPLNLWLGNISNMFYVNKVLSDCGEQNTIIIANKSYCT
eukprot:352158_1